MDSSLWGGAGLGGALGRRRWLFCQLDAKVPRTSMAPLPPLQGSEKDSSCKAQPGEGGGIYDIYFLATLPRALIVTGSVTGGDWRAGGRAGGGSPFDISEPRSHVSLTPTQAVEAG